MNSTTEYKVWGFKLDGTCQSESTVLFDNINPVWLTSEKHISMAMGVNFVPWVEALCF